MAKSRKKSKSLKVNLKYELYGIIILIISILALSQHGIVNRSLSYLFRFLIGTWDWVIPVICIYIGLFTMIRRAWPKSWSIRKSGILLFVLGLLIMSHMSMFQQLDPKGNLTSASFIMSKTWSSMMEGLQATEASNSILTHEVGGGMIGALLYAILFFLFGNLGSSLIKYTLFAIGFIMITGLSYVDLGEKVRQFFRACIHGGQSFFRSSKKTAKQTSAKSSKTQNVKNIVLEDDDLDDEEFEGPPPGKVKEKPLFFQLLQGNSRELDDEADQQRQNYSDEMETVYSANGSLSSASEYGDDEPVIRDFREMEQLQRKETPIDTPESLAMTEEPQAGFTKELASSNYELPPYHLLSRPASGRGGESTDYKATARKLEATLESFGVRAKVLDVARGPAVTRYELQPDVGVKVSRIVSLTDDIALALAAKDIRMEAPIPGKAAIGIEVPNMEVSVVTMREVMESSAFTESSAKLSIAFGRDISGQAIVGNLAKMPHLLVAGATGSGKSVCINGIITSILYKAHPDEVKFLMIDPKMVELNVYNGIPHLLAPVVTDPRRASLALKKVVSEMEKRYELFSKSGTRNIEGYNTLVAEKGDGTQPFLPYIVVIVDELADLMMVAANDVEDAICRLAQMARAAGIHLIIATQRPSVDVITGVIKANIPSRIAFGVSSQVDSRTILDMAGAEKLLGRGDMLFLPMGASKPIRVQGAFLSDQEVEAVVAFSSNQGKATYQEEMVPEVEEMTDQREEFEDDLYDHAVQIVLEAKQASVSLLQRRMRVGYTRAARLIDTMEAKGIVGPYEGSKPREVLISLEQYQHNRISS